MIVLPNVARRDCVLTHVYIHRHEVVIRITSLFHHLSAERVRVIIGIAFSRIVANLPVVDIANRQVNNTICFVGLPRDHVLTSSAQLLVFSETSRIRHLIQLHYNGI